MIELYTWDTPNGKKISIMLEEIKMPYEVHPINLKQNKQFEAEFLAISPNNKIPAIIDRDGPEGRPYSIFESGAILIYLAEKSGQLIPKEGCKHYDVLQWLMFQMGGVGPMFGQAHVFMHSAPEKIPFAIERYHQEAKRLYGVMDRRLANCEFLAGNYSIADIATFSWVARHERHAVPLADFPNVKRWFDTIGTRPAVRRGMEIPKV